MVDGTGPRIRHLDDVPWEEVRTIDYGDRTASVREKWIDEHYIATRTTGFDAVRRSVAAYWPERVERITGVVVRETLPDRLLDEAEEVEIIDLP